jgi:hypothetical protein
VLDAQPTIAVDKLAIGDLLQPGGSSPLADCLRQMPDPPPPDGPPQPQSLLAAAARQLSGGRDQACAALLDAAELLLDKLPGDQAITFRVAKGQA